MRNINITQAISALLPALLRQFNIVSENENNLALLGLVKTEVLKLSSDHPLRDIYSKLISACQGVGISLTELSETKCKLEELRDNSNSVVMEAVSQLIYDKLSDDKQIPPAYIDSISMEIFLLPVVVSPIGRTYCVSTINGLRRQSSIIFDPNDRTRLNLLTPVIFNADLYRQIQAWCEENHLLDYWKKMQMKANLPHQFAMLQAMQDGTTLEQIYTQTSTHPSVEIAAAAASPSAQTQTTAPAARRLALAVAASAARTPTTGLALPSPRLFGSANNTEQHPDFRIDWSSSVTHPALRDSAYYKEIFDIGIIGTGGEGNIAWPIAYNISPRYRYEPISLGVDFVLKTVGNTKFRLWPHIFNVRWSPLSHERRADVFILPCQLSAETISQLRSKVLSCLEKTDTDFPVPIVMLNCSPLSSDEFRLLESISQRLGYPLLNASDYDKESFLLAMQELHYNHIVAQGVDPFSETGLLQSRAVYKAIATIDEREDAEGQRVRPGCVIL